MINQEPNKVLNPHKVFKVAETCFANDKKEEPAASNRKDIDKPDQSYPMLSTRRNVCVTDRYGKNNTQVEISPYDLDLIDETCEMMKDLLHASKCKQDLQNEACQVVLENVHLYLNKIRMFHESNNSSGSMTTRPVKKPSEQINEAHLRLKRTLRMYDDLIDEYELRGSDTTKQIESSRETEIPFEKSPKKNNPFSQPASNFKKKKEEATPETTDDFNLLELEVPPSITNRAQIDQGSPRATDNYEDDFPQVNFNEFIPMSTARPETEDDFFSLIANRPSTYRANLAIN